MVKPSSSRPTVEPDSKTAHDLMSVLPTTARVCDGHLCIGGVDMVTLAREAGTALYVMDEATIRSQLRDYVKWTAYHWKDVDVVYAGKAFMSVAMCKIVAEEGCCLDVSSGGELAFALRAGFPMERIYVHGNNKTPVELAECLDARVGRIVVDSFEEMDRLSAMAAERGGNHHSQQIEIDQIVHGRFRQASSRFGIGPEPRGEAPLYDLPPATAPRRRVRGSAAAGVPVALRKAVPRTTRPLAQRLGVRPPGGRAPAAPPRS